MNVQKRSILLMSWTLVLLISVSLFSVAPPAAAQHVYNAVYGNSSAIIINKN